MKRYILGLFLNVLISISWLFIVGDTILGLRLMLLSFTILIAIILLQLATNIYKIKWLSVLPCYKKTIVVDDFNDEEIRKILTNKQFQFLSSMQAIFIKKTYGSFNSFGEVITVEIKIENNVKNIEIFSRPRWILTLADSGKNYKNVTEVERAILNHP